MPREERPLQERFWEKVDKESTAPCWSWTAGLALTGYGQIFLGTAEGRPGLTHRVSYEMHFGPIPEGFEIHHVCNNRRCVNPSHLELLTKKRHREITAEARWEERKSCSLGHPFDEENTVWGVKPSGGRTRSCRICLRREWREATRRRNAKRKAAALHPSPASNEKI